MLGHEQLVVIVGMCTAIGNLDHSLKQDCDRISNQFERRIRWLNEGNSPVILTAESRKSSHDPKKFCV